MTGRRPGLGRPVPRLRGVRYAVRGVLLVGVAASLAANMLHAQPNYYSRIISAWPPLALFGTIEVISRVPVSRAWVARVRVAATILIGAIAAWVSYWHMAAVAARFGEHGATPYLLPLSVDGLVVVASISLFELADRIHTPQPVNSAGSARGPARAKPLPLMSPARRGDADYRTGMPDAMATGGPGGGRARVAAAIVDLRRREPGLSLDTIAGRVGRSKRTVQRAIKDLDGAPPSAAPAGSGQSTVGQPR